MTLSSLRYLLKEGFKNLWCNRTMSLASIAVLVSCLLLTGAAVVFSMNVNEAMKSLEANNSVQVYLDDGLNNLESIAVGNEIKKIENVDPNECEFISKDEAILKYTDMLGSDGQILNGLTGTNNPLPNAYRVTLLDLEKYDETVRQIGEIDGVYKVLDSSDIAEKLTRMDRVVQIICICVVSFLGIVSLFIISNTIRVTMYSRRLEISIMKSVGATNGFIRIPFVVEGMIIGMISGAISSGFLLLAYGQVAGVVSGIMASFQAIPMSNFSWWIVLGFLLAGVLFGMVGGLISMGKYLRKEGDSIVL